MPATIEIAKEGGMELASEAGGVSQARRHRRQGGNVTAYVLPDLDYDVGALEPHVSGKIMELHHGKHHKAYVDKANETLEKLEEARGQRDYSRLVGLEKALAFNLSGHVLHSIFWKNLTPDGGDAPSGELGRFIARDFGSFESFKEQLTEVAATIMGSGWAALVWEPMAHRLLTCQIYDHQSNLSQGGIALMVIDAWEHAYYLQYRNDKAAFFKSLWKVWNWDDIAARFEAAQQVNLKIPASAERTAEKAPASALERGRGR